MTLAGRKPKDGPKINHHSPTHDWLEIPNVPFEGSPDLPLDWADEWHAAALRWYENVRTLPHAVLWDDRDWDYVHVTASILNDAMLSKATSRFVEFRQREKEIAVTSFQRRDQRIRYVEPETLARVNDDALVLVLPPKLKRPSDVEKYEAVTPEWTI